MVRTDRADLFIPAEATLGEGPVWDPSSRALLWVDATAGRVFRYESASETVSFFDVGQPVGSVALRRRGGLVMAVQDGFALLDRSGSKPSILRVDHEADDAVMNDGKCDRLGRFWAGSATRASPGTAALYRLEPSGRIDLVIPGVTMSNGLDWSPDDRLMYYVDSALQRVDVFDYIRESGSLANRRTLVQIPSSLGIPDGLTVDADGYLWLAIWGSGRVHRYSPSGCLDRVVHVPATNVTSCTFGGGSNLIITSARVGLSSRELEAQPHAGSVFRYPAGIRGLPSRSFAG